MKFRRWLGLVAWMAFLGPVAASQTDEALRASPLPYNLAQVRHIESFSGPPRMKELLTRQGFVVTEEQFRQIFEPYLPQLPGKALPVFITVDSAWHTYHVLLEEGVQQVELRQAGLLRRFSERLHQLASGKVASGTVYRDLAAFAAVGWAVQDPACLPLLPADEQAEVAKALVAMKSGGPALFFELPSQPQHFRPAGFYTKTPELARYFTARRWYATSAFRLKSETETLRALSLTWLVDSDAELKQLHRQLTTPAETMVGPADDPGIVQYAELASRLAKGPLSEDGTRRILGDFRRAATTFPGPRINDQFLLPAQFAAREDETKGLRLFGACQLPSAVLFQKTTEPSIANRGLPSGVDVFAAGPLACEAGRRALKATKRNPAVCAAVCRTDCGLLPESLHGRAMQLLHLLHEPLPATAPLALQTPAWQDKQLWTALGAWAEERHTWVLHTKQAGAAGCAFEEPPGYVSPYPKFYRQLGGLARQAAAVLGQITPPPDLAAAGREWLEARRPPPEKPEGDSAQFAVSVASPRSTDQALAEYFRATGQDIEAASTLDRARAWAALDAGAARCIANKGVTDRDRRCMAAFLRARMATRRSSCPSLPSSATGWRRSPIRNSPGGRSLRAKRRSSRATARRWRGSTFTRATRGAIPATISPASSRSSTIRCEGRRSTRAWAARRRSMSCCSTARSWHYTAGRCSATGSSPGRWAKGRTTRRGSRKPARPAPPSPPAWTASFRCTANQQEQRQMAEAAIARLRKGKVGAEDLPLASHEATLLRIERLLKRLPAAKKPTAPTKKKEELSEEEETAAEKAEEVRAKAAEECRDLYEQVLDCAVNVDVPDLLDRLFPALDAAEIDDLFLCNLPNCIGRLNWEPYRPKLTLLLHDSRPGISDCAAQILGSRPEKIDAADLVREYDRQPPHVRANYCYLLGQSPRAGAERVRVLAAALGDKSAAVRRQAAKAVAQCRAASAEIASGIRRGVAEQDHKVAVDMVRAAVALGLHDSAPAILARLRKRLKELKTTDATRPGDNPFGGPSEPLVEELVAGLGRLKYQPAKDVLRELIFPNSPRLADYAVGGRALKAMLEIEPQNKLQLLAEIFRDPRCPGHILEQAIVEVTETNNVHYVKIMLPLFEDAGRTGTKGQLGEAVWAAWHIAPILERAAQHDPQAAEIFERIRGTLLKQTRGPGARDALDALKHFDPAAAARECLRVALDRKMDKDVRTEAIAILRDAPEALARP